MKNSKKTTDSVSPFQKRFEALYDEMKYLYCRVYDGDMQAFEYFCNTLSYYYRERSQTLRNLDARRLKRVAWFKDRGLLGMQLYVNCFADNIQGLMDRLDYIKDCGVRYLHIMPLLQMPESDNDGGYAVSDFRSIKPDLGTLDEFKKLTSMCHKKHIAVCLDFVLNHTSDQHEWARRARQGEQDYMNRYFMFDNWDIPRKYEQGLPEVFPRTAPGNFT